MIDLAETGHGDVVKLKDVKPPEWRLRIGDRRAFFRFRREAREIHVLRVRRRDKAYGHSPRDCQGEDTLALGRGLSRSKSGSGLPRRAWRSAGKASLSVRDVTFGEERIAVVWRTALLILKGLYAHQDRDQAQQIPQHRTVPLFTWAQAASKASSGESNSPRWSQRPLAGSVPPLKPWPLLQNLQSWRCTLVTEWPPFARQFSYA